MIVPDKEPLSTGNNEYKRVNFDYKKPNFVYW